jgi:3-mercaptopyruvate sulfurtransferase SseA
MDPAGAAALQTRLEQQRHWQLAAAVQEGRQPRADPDIRVLMEFRGEERLYNDEHDGLFVKRLIDGAWARFMTDQDGAGHIDGARSIPANDERHPVDAQPRDHRQESGAGQP